MLRGVLVSRKAARLIVVGRKMKGNIKEKERRGETNKRGRKGICSKLSCAGGQAVKREAMDVRLKKSRT
jgi:hypothetical protein